MYLLRESAVEGEPRVQLLGSGTILREVRRGRRAAAQTTSASPPTSGASRASPSSRATACEAERWNLLHPTEEPRRVATSRPQLDGHARARSSRRPTTCARSPSRSGPYVPGALHACSAPTASAAATTACKLRRFFEVDRHYVAVAALKALADERRARAGRACRRRSRRTASTPTGPRRCGSESEERMSTATAASEVLVPDIGDFADVPIIEVLVAPGDTVAAEDPLVTLESDKATMDVPVAVRRASSQELKVEGRRQGLRGHAAAHARRRPTRREARAGRPSRWPSRRERGAGAGRGVAPSDGAPAAARRRRRGRGVRPTPADETAAPALREPGRAPARRASSASTSRRSGLRAQGPHHRRRRARVRKAGRAGGAGRRAGGGGGLDLLPWPTIDFAKYGEVERVPLSRIKKISGPNLAPQLGDDPARHPQRRGRHHRPRGVPQGDQRGLREAGRAR